MAQMRGGRTLEPPHLDGCGQGQGRDHARRGDGDRHDRSRSHVRATRVRAAGLARATAPRRAASRPRRAGNRTSCAANRCFQPSRDSEGKCAEGYGRRVLPAADGVEPERAADAERHEQRQARARRARAARRRTARRTRDQRHRNQTADTAVPAATACSIAEAGGKMAWVSPPVIHDERRHDREEPRAPDPGIRLDTECSGW